MQVIASNKKAFFDYIILENFEAGLVLLGSEVKAVRAKKVNISGSYIKPLVQNGQAELWWIGSQFSVESGDKSRTKKILLNKREINRLLGRLSAGEYTIVPLELYFVRGNVKLKIGLATKKQKHDKREVIKKKTSDREIRQEYNRRR